MDELPTPNAAQPPTEKAPDTTDMPPTIRRPSLARSPGEDSARAEADRKAAAVAEAANRAIQQRAALKAAERTRRLETFKWYGYSPSRPTVTLGGTSGSDGNGAVTLGPPVLFHAR